MLVRSLVGAIALLISFGPLIAGSLALRRRVLPRWSGPPGWLAQFVLVLTASLGVVLVLGVMGWYDLVPTTLLLAATGMVMWAGASRLAPREGPEPARQPERLGRPAQIIAVVAVALVVATWSARTYVALSHGMVSIDSLWYHLPQAARFAHGHSITGIHHDVDGLSGFYPINAELIHSLGMVLLGNDYFSMVLNAAWGVVALVAAWCIGRAHGMAAVCVTGLAVLLCAPAFVGTQPGAAHNDIVGVALVLVSAALLVIANPRRLTDDPFVLALAAMPVGFAVGTKWTLVPISVALTLGVIVLLPRGRRIRLSALWLAIVGAIGSFSYVRNLVRVGSPVPSVNLQLGSFGWARKAPEMPGMGNVVQFLVDGSAWRDWLLPGLSEWFGYAWWAVLGVIGLGLMLAVVTGPGSVTRMLGCVGAVALVGYIAQPQLIALYGEPYFFAANLRYATASMALALVLLPLSPLFRRRVVMWLPPIGFLVIILVMQLDAAVWPTDLRELRWEEPVQGADAVAGLVMGVVALAVGLTWLYSGPRWRSRWRTGPEETTDRPASPRRSRLAALPAVAVVGLVLFGTIGIDQWYLGHRYTRPDAPTPFLPRHWRSWEWARDVHDERVGFKAPALSYPLYGNRLSNVVEALPDTKAPAGQPAATAAEQCETLFRAVNARRYTYVVLYGSLAPTGLPADAPTFEQLTPEVTWLASDPAAKRVFEAPLEAVYLIDGTLDPRSCAAFS